MSTNDEDFVVAIEAAEVCKVLERYPDGSVRVQLDKRQVVLDPGEWAECEE